MSALQGLQLQEQFLFFFAGQVVHVLLNGLNPSVYLDLQVGVLLLQPNYRPLESHYLVPLVYLLVVQLLYCHCPVNRRLQTLHLRLQVQIVGVQSQRTLPPLQLCV